MIAIIFEVYPKAGKLDEYLDIAAIIRPIAEATEGFISVERFQSLTNPDKYLSISYFEDEAAVDRWRNVTKHREAQSRGRKNIFDDYRIRVVSVLRDYTMTDRSAVPDDSLDIHQG
ncbi:MAG: antibiotic biosynthesis monooxygenase family protein [Candidatus Puniceispirillales bacterium]